MDSCFAVPLLRVALLTVDDVRKAVPGAGFTIESEMPPVALSLVLGVIAAFLADDFLAAIAAASIPPCSSADACCSTLSFLTVAGA